MSDAPPPPLPPLAPRKSEPSDCVACGKDLSSGTGRFLLSCGPVCVSCYDAGYRCPAEKKPD